MHFSRPRSIAGTQTLTNSYVVAPARSHLLLTAALTLVISSVLQLGTVAIGQDLAIDSLPPCEEVEMAVDSGLIDNADDRQQVVWSETVAVDDAKWLQLQFSDVILTKGRKLESLLKITSLEDGAFQILDAECVAQWGGKSAFFNGDAVKVELLAHANAEKNCVVIDAVTAGTAQGESVPESICDAFDNRVLSNDPRVGRLDSGCTAWLFDGRSNDLITAGHCAASMEAVFFNVPLSDLDGTINFPPPEDQYAVCLESIQFVNGGVGNDWCYFGVFNNSNTGLSPLAAQGSSFAIQVPNSNTFGSGDLIRVTGYGITGTFVDRRWNQALTTHAGPFSSFTGNTLRYRPDTTAGNSGSPVIDAGSDIAYGVHTHGGCFNRGGANQGTGFNHPDFLSAINNPQGACDSPASPANDDCLDAILVGNGTREFDTSFATTDGPDLPLSCDEGFGVSFVRDVWFEYTASCTGQATFDFCDSDYDTRVAVYSIDSANDGDCVGDLIGCNDDSCGLQSELTVAVVRDEVYLVRVGGVTGGGLGTMTITCAGVDCSAHVDVVGGVMIINATQGPDSVIVSQVSDLLQVSVNFECFETFSRSGIDQIVVNGYGGADLIQIDATVKTLIDGGSGADVIHGGSLAGDITGGPGGDLIFGGPADDTISAGFGADTVFGFGGNDVINGGSAGDVLVGGAGDDQLFGGLGGDSISGGNGNDLLIGHAGADELSGDGGDDELIGLGGPDDLIGGAGNDEFFGGAGFDTIDGGGGTDAVLDDGEIEIRIEST